MEIIIFNCKRICSKDNTFAKKKTYFVTIPKILLLWFTYMTIYLRFLSAKVLNFDFFVRMVDFYESIIVIVKYVKHSTSLTVHTNYIDFNFGWSDLRNYMLNLLINSLQMCSIWNHIVTNEKVSVSFGTSSFIFKSLVTRLFYKHKHINLLVSALLSQSKRSKMWLIFTLFHMTLERFLITCVSDRL